MSFDAYLQVFQEHVPAGLSDETVQAPFGKHLVQLEVDYWQVRYESDQSCDIFLQPLAGSFSIIHTVTFHRPCEDVRLWQSIWALLEVLGSILHFPGSSAPLARDVSAALAMPPAMLQSLGTPVLVAGPQAIQSAIRAGA